MALQNVFTGLAGQDDMEQLTAILRAILEKLPFVDPSTASARVTILGTPPVNVTTATTVTTVGTLSNITNIANLAANGDQYTQWQIPFSNLRASLKIT